MEIRIDLFLAPENVVEAECWIYRIDPNHFLLMPTAGDSTPAERMTLTGLLVDLDTAAADFNILAAVALIGRHDPDADTAVLIELPDHERQ